MYCSLQELRESYREINQPVTIQSEFSENSYGDFFSLYGNVIWPCSVLMEKELGNISHIFNNKRVLELGCGKAFTSLKFIKYNPSTIVMTDGSDKIIESAPKDLPERCRTAVLKYGYVLQNEKPFDVIVGSDIIYGLEYFTDLCYTIKQSLSLHGTCYLFCAQRANILDMFINEIRKVSMTIDSTKLDSSCLHENNFGKNDGEHSGDNFHNYFMLKITHSM